MTKVAIESRFSNLITLVFTCAVYHVAVQHFVGHCFIRSVCIRIRSDHLNFLSLR